MAPFVAVAAALAAMHLAGIAGVDSAAHVYRIDLLRQGQSLVWDDFWYSGSYGVLSYGIVFFEIARFTGAAAIVVVSAGSLPLSFHLYLRRAWHVQSMLPALALAVVLVIYLVNGQEPFLLAMALTMAGLALLASGHPLWGAVPVGIAVFTNPLALAIGGMFVLADTLARPAARRRVVLFAAALAPFLLGWAGLQRALAGHTSYLAQPGQLLKWTAVSCVGVALAGWSARRGTERGDQRRQGNAPDHDGAMDRRHDTLALQLLFAGAGVLCVAGLAFPSLGNNATRLYSVFGLSLFLLLPRKRLPWAATAAVLAAVAAMQLATPLTFFAVGGETLQSSPSYFAPALAVAAREYDPAYRFHVVALAKHGEAQAFPLAGYAITRGWFRQADWQHDALLYDHPDAARYVAWLRDLGVNDVFVPRGALDATSAQEPGLIAASGALQKIYDTGRWTVYRLRDPRPLIVPVGAAVTATGHDKVVISVRTPGRYVVKVTWSPYWRVISGRAALGEAAGDWLSLDAPAAGSVVLGVRPTLGEVLRQIF